MSFKYKELFVLFVILEAKSCILGLALDNTSTGKNLTKDLSPVTVTTEKFQNANADNGTTESVTVVIPNSSTVLPQSTESSNKTTTAAPPTPPSPNPVLEPWKTGKWVVRNDTTNTTCIIAEMAVQLNITYPGKDKLPQNKTINVPYNATGNGSCKDTPQFLKITWGPGHWLLINFEENKTAKNYFIRGISLNVNATVLKDASGNYTMLQFSNNSTEFASPVDMSYKCNKIQNVNLEGKLPNTSAVVYLKNTQYEAYMNKTTQEFAAAYDCDAYDTPDVVPIAVGCALAILVLVVLVAYLIARRRSRNQGYRSM